MDKWGHMHIHINTITAWNLHVHICYHKQWWGTGDYYQWLHPSWACKHQILLVIMSGGFPHMHSLLLISVALATCMYMHVHACTCMWRGTIPHSFSIDCLHSSIHQLSVRPLQSENKIYTSIIYLACLYSTSHYNNNLLLLNNIISSTDFTLWGSLGTWHLFTLKWPPLLRTSHTT
jgi:hypothetical protein